MLCIGILTFLAIIFVDINTDYRLIFTGTFIRTFTGTFSPSWLRKTFTLQYIRKIAERQ